MPATQNQDPARANFSESAPTPDSLSAPNPETPSSGGGTLRIIIVALLLIGAGAFIYLRIKSNTAAADTESKKAAAAANRATPVQVALVQQKTVPVFLTALGTVTAYNTVTLHTRVDGQLLHVNFTEGQNVRKGQLLVEIDPAPYQAAVDQAIGTLTKDEANLKNMAAESQRYTALYQAGVVSKEQEQLEISNEGQAAGSIKADQAAIEAAKVNLNYTRIYSPIDGVVGLRQVDPGNIVHAADTTGLVVITQVHPIAVIFTLPEDQLPQVQKALKTTGSKKLTVEAYDRTDAHLIATGSLLTIDNQIDTTTGTAKLKAVFDNTDNGLFANQFVNVRLILSERANATVVPTAAIQSGTQGDYVYIVNPGPTPKEKLKNLPNAGTKAPAGAGAAKPAADPSAAPADASADPNKPAAPPRPKFHADAVPVHVDFVIGTNSVLADGALKPNQRVITDGQEKLVDGSMVSVPEPKATGGKPAAPPPDSASPQPDAAAHHGHKSASASAGAPQ